MVIEGYRSCPFRCGFCSSPGVVRHFSMDRIRAEIEFAFAHDLESLLFIDPLMNIGRKRLLEICDILYGIDPAQDKLTGCIVMAELLDQATVAALARVNVRHAEMGLQSTNPVVLKNIRRVLHPARYERAIRLLQDAGIVTHLQLIAGLPGDTFDGLRRSLDFALELAPDYLSCFTPLLLPGTYLYEQRDRLGIRYDERAPHVIFSHYTMDSAEMQRAVEYGQAVCRQYNRQAEVRRVFLAERGSPAESASSGSPPDPSGRPMHGLA